MMEQPQSAVVKPNGLAKANGAGPPTTRDTLRKRRGPKTGPTARLTEKTIARIRKLAASGVSIAKIAKKLGRADSTIYRYLNETTGNKKTAQEAKGTKKTSDAPTWTIPMSVLGWMRDAYREDYREVRKEHKEFSIGQHLWHVGYKKLLSMQSSEDD